MAPHPPLAPELNGAVDVCVSVPKLTLDRPFTYVLPDGAGAGIGSLVSVPFHGRSVRGWVLGPAGRDVPGGRLLSVRKVVSPVRFFDDRMLEVLRWVGERYLAPLSAVIDRSYPPRVASEEKAFEPFRPGPRAGRDGHQVMAAGGATWLRPLPGEEVSACVRAVAECVESGRGALVLVPEAEPLPATAAAVLAAFPGVAASFLGGEPRARYRRWLEILAGRHRVVVATRPGAFAPIPDLGLVWVSREVHPGHREDRSPYYHVREIAVARARIQGASCVLASYSPSVETAVGVHEGSIGLSRPPRQAERAAAPLVETAPPEAEDRSTRLGGMLRRAGSGALIVSRRGYGVARVCRACRRPAACGVCGGEIVVERGAAACRVCLAPGRCAACGGERFGIERGGAERIAEWAARLAHGPVAPADSLPSADRFVVGSAATVKDLGPLRVGLVAILDPDRALARAGLRSAEQALATWMEAAVWAGPKAAGGRVLVQTRSPGSPAIQALIRWEPIPFLLAEAERRSVAGFPPGAPVFRISGPPGEAMGAALAACEPVSLLTTSGPEGTVCLVAVRPEALAGFRAEVLRLAGEGLVDRVEAEPHL